ncbi:MAG: hypothetical protein PWR01_3920 [Clostridiales bacterium]|jgi:hypothetical protein|nr:hypothetical protein [Clostridiales bacterium]MDN5282847.1 hypothetical protein [Candidatus Ozemobacter sp.]
MKNRNHKIVSLALGLSLVSICLLFAGDLTPTAAPDNSASAMFKIEDLYQRLLNGTAGTKRSAGFTEPSAGPTAGTMHSLNDIMSKMPTKDDTNGAAETNVLQGKKFWGLTSGQWGPRVGSMPNIGQQNVTPTSADQSISQGYHDGSGKVAGDANLVTGNIKAGVTIFGVSGKTEVVDTTSGDAVAGDLLAGKKAWVDGTEVTGTMSNVGTQNITPGTSNVTITQGYHSGSGQVTGDADLVSGNIRAGVNLFGVSGNSNVVNTSSGDAATATIQFSKKAWVDGVEITGYLAGGTACNPAATYSPLKRWCHNGNGTITDTTTGLIWFSKGNNFWGTYASCSANISYLKNGIDGLTDGSSEYDWRLPTVKEMLTLTSGTEAISPGNQYLFTGMQTGWYWTCSAHTNPIPLKKLRVQMPYTNPYGVQENPGALFWGIAVRNP